MGYISLQASQISPLWSSLRRISPLHFGHARIFSSSESIIFSLPTSGSPFDTSPGGVAGPLGNVLLYPFSILSGASASVLTATQSTLSTGSIPASNGLLVFGSILDDIQAFFLFRAVQSSRESTIMSAPRVTVLNGQVAYLVQARTQDYVANTGSVPQTGGGTGLQVATTNSVIGRLQTGVLFQLRPTVSWDRRYVKVDLVATFNDFLQFRTYSLIGPLVDADNPDAGTEDSTISQPETQRLLFRTTVSCPDRGTIIIGGVNQAFQSDIDSGIPILSKLPLIGVLFSDRGMGREKELTILLMRPEIVIQEERDPYESRKRIHRQ